MTKLAKRFACFLLAVSLLLSSSAPLAFAATNYTYDLNGNMASDGTNCYTYNDANRLSKVKICASGQLVAEYLYDHEGNRIVKKEYQNGVLSQTIYSPKKEFETKKLADGTTQKTTYYYANDELVAKKNPDNSKNYYLNDHLGSTSMLTNQVASLVEESSYYPFGEVRAGGVQSKYQFTGQEKDVNTGLNYYGARYYNSHIFHFTQPDSELPNPYDPQQLNRYSYTRNNPLKYTDKTGNFIQIPAGLAIYAYTLTSSPDLQADSMFLAQSWNAFQENKTFLNGVAVATDLASIAIPGGSLSSPTRALVKEGEAKIVGTTGKYGEKILEEAYQGIRQKYHKVPNFSKGRYVDMEIPRILNEAKTGYQTINKSILRQIAKDQALLKDPIIDEVVWHFFTSPITGKGGASEPLLKLLKDSGFQVLKDGMRL